MLDADRLLLALSKGPARRSELQAEFGASQPTLSRALARISARVARLGRGRSTRYALRRDIRDLREIPVSRVAADGSIRAIGTLIPVQPDGLWFTDEETGAGELFPSLPWFIADMRPQGFLGRLFAYRCHDRGLPERLADWNDNHALYALAVLGEDAPGNLLLGTESHERWQQRRRSGPSPIELTARARRYAEIVARVLAGDPAGSSAGGEQQKFGVELQIESGELRPCIVKFSPSQRESVGRRWADLLVWEHLALESIRRAGIPAAGSSLFDDGERYYLEVTRFDRIGPQGRRGVVSFGALDDAFVGQRRNWSATAQELARQGWIGRDAAERAAWLEAYGRLIGNTDMHMGNLAVIHEGARPFALAPAYDMLPMAYAPRATGEMRVAPLDLPALPPPALHEARGIAEAAVGFWQRAANDARVSPQGQAIAAANAAVVAPLAREA